VAVSIDFTAPLYFEDEFDVHVRIEAISRRTIRYAHTVTRGDTVIATGTMTAACVRRQPAPMRAVEIPPEILARLAPIARGNQP
jgi:acyl-CoA thioesterase FadM